mgnify:CR=1 FL=1
MLTPFDKALVALIMAALAVWNMVAPWHIGLTEEQVTMLITLAAPVFVYLVPNKKPQ